MPADQLFSLRGKTIVLTGSAGQLGSAIVKGLRTAGANVGVIDRTRPIEAGEQVLQCTADVSNRGDLEACPQRIEERFGPPDGLVNGAGIDAPPDASANVHGPFEEVATDMAESMFRVNFLGALIACQVFSAAMAKRGTGSIVNIGSIYGLVSPDQLLYEFRRAAGEQFYKPVAYGASKAALHSLTQYLATYWGGLGVRSNTSCFGGFRSNQDAAFVAAYASRVPLGRMADLSEAMGPLTFLLSDASSYVSGSLLVCDGGLTAW